MCKAIISALGEVSLELLSDLLKQNNIATMIIDGKSNSSSDMAELIADENLDCLMVQNVAGTYQQLHAELSNLTDNVVYLFSSPTSVLSHSFKKSNSSFQPELAIESWQATLNQALALRQEHKDFFLCDLIDVMNNSAAFLADMFNIEKAKAANSKRNIEEQITDHIAELCLSDNDEVFDLYDEALAVGKLYGDFVAHLGIRSQALKQSAMTLGQSLLSQCARNQEELKSKQDEVNTLLNNNKELAEKKTLVEKLKVDIDALDRNKQTSESKLHQEITVQKGLVEQLSVKYDALEKLKKTNEAQLKQELAEQKSLAEDVTNELNALMKSKMSVQSELESVMGDFKKAQNKVNALSSDLGTKDSTIKIQSDANKELTRMLEVTTVEYELQKALVGQLQCELEASCEKLQVIKSSHESLKVKLSDFENLKQQLACETNDKKSALQKVTKLLKEKEVLHEQNKKLLEEKTSIEEQLAAEQQEANDVVKNAEEMAAQLTLERKLTQRLEREKTKLQEQLNTFEVVMNNQSEYQQVELELASLQISQLQDELEYYYAALQDTRSQGRTLSDVPKYYQNVFSKAQSDGLTVTGKYATEGYNDAQLMLSNVQLGDGRIFNELPIKLINVGGHVAIEFREDADGRLFTHYADMTDEYGPYLRYFANPSEADLAQQKLLESRMTSSERIMVMSSILLIAELIQEQQGSSLSGFNNEEWRNWRLSAFRLAETLLQVPSLLTFDIVRLKEEYRTDGYEHLWLSFDSVLIGGVWRSNLELKVAARNVSRNEGGVFSDDISLEFRELDDGTAPLVTWPPANADEYGPKFEVFLSRLEELDTLAHSDRSLIEHIVKNLSDIVGKIDDKSGEMSRPIEDWQKSILAMSESADKPAITQTKDNAYSFVLDEVISMGAYEHILFVEEASKIKVKLKAENINLETLAAEIFIELRNGSYEIIYNDTQFFGEDEYGPRVLVPFEVILMDLVPNKKEQFNWLIDVYEQMFAEIADGNSVEPLVKAQWLKMLANQFEINS